MGRRRARARAPPPRRPILPEVFDCLFCSGRDTVEVRADRIGRRSYLKCRTCPARFVSKTSHLWHPVDAYHEWLDKTREANYEPEESYHSLGGGSIPERAPARAACQPSGDVNAMLERDEQHPDMHPKTASSQQRNRSRSTQSWSSSSSRSDRASSEADELQGKSHGVASSSRSARAASPAVELQGRIEEAAYVVGCRSGVPEQDEHRPAERHAIAEAEMNDSPTTAAITQSLDRETSEVSASEVFRAWDMVWDMLGSPGSVSTARADAMRAPAPGAENDNGLPSETTPTLPRRNKILKPGKQVNLGRRQSVRLANRVVLVPQITQQTRKNTKNTSGRMASVKTRTHAAAAQPVAAQPAVESTTEAAATPNAVHRPENEELYAVQRLVRPTIFEGECSYIVSWKGYKEPTVEPRCNLLRDVESLVQSFERDHVVKWRNNPCRFTWRRRIASRRRKAR